jgi:hypothetical protein
MTAAALEARIRGRICYLLDMNNFFFSNFNFCFENEDVIARLQAPDTPFALTK